MITKLYYSTRNNGDGSASVIFMESKELAELDQEYVYEGFAEDCSSFVAIESNSTIRVDEIVTVEDMIKETKKDMEYDDSENTKEKLQALEKLQGEK